MKTQIPKQLKADLPQSTFGKLLAATPVVMTVVATREMTAVAFAVYICFFL